MFMWFLKRQSSYLEFFEATEFVLGISSIENKIGELRFYEYNYLSQLSISSYHIDKINRK